MSREKKLDPRLELAKGVMNKADWVEVELGDGKIYKLCIVDGGTTTRQIANLMNSDSEDWSGMSNKIVISRNNRPGESIERLTIISDDMNSHSLITSYIVEEYGRQNVLHDSRRNQSVLNIGEGIGGQHRQNLSKYFDFGESGKLITIDILKDIILKHSEL